jgi:hypothetical protein
MAESFRLEVLQGRYEDREISGAYTSDLLSDVMANAHSDSVLVTIQAHKNTVAVASLLGIAAILVCNGRPVPADMLDSAAAEGIAILRGEGSQFELSGRLWVALGGDAFSSGRAGDSA